MMTANETWQSQDSNVNLDESTVCALCSLLVVIWRSNAGIFGCSFLQVPSIYCISSVSETAGVIWERTFMSHCLPVLSSRYEKSIHRKTMENFTKCKSDWVTGHHSCLWSGSYAPIQPVPYLASILDARVGDSCGGSGLSAVDLMHCSTTSCIRSSMYSEDQQFTFLPKYIKYHVNSR